MCQNMKILLTRPLKDSKKLSLLLKKKGYLCEITPLLRVERIKYEVPKQCHPDIIFITSRNAARLFDFDALNLDNTSIIVLGKKTGQYLQNKIKKKLTYIDGDEHHLLSTNYLSLIPKGSKVLHPTSQIRNRNLTKFFKKRKCQYFPVCCYKALKKNEFESQFINFIKYEKGLITIFSSRTAESFSKEIIRLDLKKFCSEKKVLVLSKKILKKLVNISFDQFFISKEPNLLSMIKEIDLIFKREIF